MAKWKMMGQLALAVREAEKQAEQKRILEEQRRESIRNGCILRKLERQKARIAHRLKAPNVRDSRILKTLNTEMKNAECNAVVARGACHRNYDEKYVDQIVSSIHIEDHAKEEMSRIQKEIQLLQLKEREMDKEIRDTRQKLRIYKDGIRCRIIAPDKVVRRQEVNNHAYGLQLDQNRALRDQIKHLMGESGKIQSIHAELEKDCKDLSVLVTEYTELARNTYDSTELTRTNIVKFKEDFDKSFAAYDGDVKLLQFKIDVLKRTERFMTDKNKFRSNEGKVRKTESRTQQSILEKEAISCGNMMEHIREGLNQRDVQGIVSTFRELEEENYMLFKNISVTREACNNMTMEIEKLRAETDKLRKARKMGEQEAFARRVEMIDKSETCRKIAERNEEFIRNTDKLLNAYIKSIIVILKNLGYTPEHIEKLSGVYKCVEERNVQEFLAELENYVTKLCELKTVSEYEVWWRAQRAGDSQPPVPLPPRLVYCRSVVVVPPTYLDGDDVDDPALPTEAAFRPLNLSELAHHLDEDLDVRHRRAELGVAVPSPTMMDASSEAIGDKPKSPAFQSVHGIEGDVF